MTKFTATTLFAGAAAATILGFAAPAQAAPSGSGNAADTIASLDDRGYQVRVNHQGMVKPLDQSNIVAVQYDNDDRVVEITVR